MSAPAVDPSILVVGGGPAGLRAALDLAELGIRVNLVETRKELGGAPIRWNYKTLAPKQRPTEEVMDPLLQGVRSNPRVQVHLGAVVETFDGEPGRFRARIKRAEAGTFVDVAASAAVVATGFDHHDATGDPRYEYGRAKDVYGIHELEGMLKAGKVVCRDGRKP